MEFVLVIVVAVFQQVQYSYAGMYKIMIRSNNVIILIGSTFLNFKKKLLNSQDGREKTFADGRQNALQGSCL